MIKKKIAFALIIFLIFSCTEEGIVDDFKDMNKLKDSLEQVYPDEKIKVNISNGYYISISFINSELKKEPKNKKEEIAEEVGKITKHFFKDKRIEEGSLVFAIHKNYVIFNYSESLDIYDLKLDSDSTSTNKDTVTVYN